MVLGVLGIPARNMAKTILQSVITYINGNSATGLQRIDVVIFQPGMVNEFVDSMKKSIEKKDSWWSRVATWITGNASAAASYAS